MKQVWQNLDSCFSGGNNAFVWLPYMVLSLCVIWKYSLEIWGGELYHAHIHTRDILLRENKSKNLILNFIKASILPSKLGFSLCFAIITLLGIPDKSVPQEPHHSYLGVKGASVCGLS